MKIHHDIKCKARVGIYSAGLRAYWDQFPNLRERLIAYGSFIETELKDECEVYNYGMVDDESEGVKAGEWFNAQNVDLIFCHSATYFTSASVVPVHQRCKAQIILLNLQPTRQLNYQETSTGEWLANCGACPMPELINAFNRAGISCKIINGLLGLREQTQQAKANEITADSPEAIRAWKEIREWVAAASVKSTLLKSRFGFLGNNYSGMLDLYSDCTMLQVQTGLHIEILEMCDLADCIGQINDGDVKRMSDSISNFFEISGDSPSDPIARMPTEEQLAWSCKIAAAQEKMINKYKLNGLAYYYHGSNNEYEKMQSGFIVGHSLLTAAGVPCAGEGDLKTAIAMKICDILEKGGSFCEIVAVDYDEGTILIGHDGPFHIHIADEKPVLRGMGVYHGKKGTGVSVEARVKAGPITTLGITQTIDGKLRMIISEGEAVRKPTLMIGNTQTHIDWGCEPDLYMEKWFETAPTHHCALSVGHNQSLFIKTATLLGIEYAIV